MRKGPRIRGGALDQSCRSRGNGGLCGALAGRAQNVHCGEDPQTRRAGPGRIRAFSGNAAASMNLRRALAGFHDDREWLQLACTASNEVLAVSSCPGLSRDTLRDRAELLGRKRDLKTILSDAECREIRMKFGF